MNKVYLSGTVSGAVRYWQPEIGAAHAVFDLLVSYRTAKGQIRRELYPINAWLKTAQWAQSTLKPGMPVSLQGYLTQKMMMEAGTPRTSVEVTAGTFMLLAAPAGGDRSVPMATTLPRGGEASSAENETPLPEEAAAWT